VHLAQSCQLLQELLGIDKARLHRRLGAAHRVLRGERRLRVDDALLDRDRLVELVLDEFVAGLGFALGRTSSWDAGGRSLDARPNLRWEAAGDGVAIQQCRARAWRGE
jgi:hypothetical protein